MKVTVIYDFENASSLEDFSKDKVNVEMSYEEWEELTDILLDYSLEIAGTGQCERVQEMYKRLRKYSTRNLK